MNRDVIDKEVLAEMYLGKYMSMNEISQKLNVSVGKAFKYLKEYGIPSRQRMTDRTKRKISIAKSGAHSSIYGFKMSDEAKKKISVSKKGKYKKPSEYGGHKKTRSDGYISVYNPDHPRAVQGYVMEHILVAEKTIGRKIHDGEVVHHINHVRNDNRPENLMVLSFSEHARIHMAERHANNQIKHHTQKVVNVTTGEVFDSVKNASVKYGVSSTSIRKACKNNAKSCNCNWKYL